MNDATQLIDNNGQLGQHRLSSAVEMGVMVGWSAALIVRERNVSKRHQGHGE